MYRFKRPLAAILTILLIHSAGHTTAPSALAEESLAQPAGAEPGPIEVVVTGTSFPDRLLQIPGSVTTISEEAATDRGAFHLQEIVDLVPNFSWAGGTNRPAFFQIRGVGEVEQYEGAPNPSVGVYMDDIDLTGLGSVAGLFDVTQVEAIRGPQGTRYGANALAGVLALRSAPPTDYFSGRTEIGAGSDDLFSGGVAVGGPADIASGDLTFRFSAHSLRSNGFRRNDFLDQDDTNGRDEVTSRLKAEWTPTQDFRAEVSGLWFDFDNGYDAFAIDNSLHTQSDRPGEDGQEIAAAAIKLAWRLSDQTELSLLTSPLTASTLYSYDGDWGNDVLWSPYLPYDYFSETTRERRQFSQELRLSSYDEGYRLGVDDRWTVGIFAQRLRETSDIENSSEELIYDQLESRYVAKTAALLGEYIQPLQPGSALRIGGRVERRDSTYRDNRDNDEAPDDTMWGGSIALEHELREGALAYLSASRGFKGGGVNVSLNVPEDRRTFEPESLYTIEGGVKGEFLEGLLQGSLSGFTNIRRDIQTRLSYQSDPSDPLTFIYITDNAARARSYGAEAELLVRATERFSISLTASLLESEFTSVSSEDSNLAGREQTHAPSWQYAVSPHIALTDNLFVRLDVIGKDDFYYQDSHNAKSSPYHLLGAAIGYQTEYWKLVLWGRNLSDEKYAVRGFLFGNEPPDFPTKEYVQRGDPLQIGITWTALF